MKIITMLLCLMVGATLQAREIEFKEEETKTIVLRPGFSTSLRFPTPPKEVGLGNQELVIAEFVGDELLLKPLADRGETNLFVFLENRERFNFWLKVGAANHFSYKIKRSYEAPKEVLPGLPMAQSAVKLPLRAYRTYQGLRLHLKEIQRFDHPKLLRIDFEIENLTSSQKEIFELEHLGITHNEKSVPIDLVFAPQASIGSKNSMRGFLEVHGHPEGWDEPIRLSLLEKDAVLFSFEVSLKGLSL